MTAKKNSLTALILVAALLVCGVLTGAERQNGLTVYAAETDNIIRENLNLPSAALADELSERLPEAELCLSGSTASETVLDTTAIVTVNVQDWKTDTGHRAVPDEDEYEHALPETLEDLALQYAAAHVIINNDKIGTTLNIRTAHSTSGDVIGKFYADSEGTLRRESHGWYFIDSGDVTGWVSADYMLTGQEAADRLLEDGSFIITVTANSLNVREEPDTEAAVVGSIKKDETAAVTSYEPGWFGIVTEEGKEGYVSADYVNFGTSLKKAMTPEQEKEYLAELARLEEERRKAEEARRIAEERAARVASANASGSGNPVIVDTGRAVALSESDIRMIACIINAEACTETYHGKLAVANVILNRYRSGRWGSIHDVIFAPGQFDTAGLDRLNYYLSVEPNAKCWQAARDACAGYNNVGSHWYFCARKSFNPSRYTSYVWVDNQCFYSR